MQEQRGRSRKRKVSPAKKAMNILKRTVVAVLCFAMVAEYVPSSLTFAAEGEPVIESEGYTDEVTLDDLTQGGDESGTVSGEETGTETNNEENGESEPDEEGGSDEGTGEVTGDDEGEGTPDSEETLDSEDDENEEDAEPDGEEDAESEDDAEPEDEEGDEEDADAEDEEDADAEDEEDAESEDEEAEAEELVEEEEAAAAGAGAAVVPSTSSETSYKTVSATIYTDDTYEEKLSDGATIELSGKMPKGAEVKAYPVEVEIEDITVLAAYDITIFDEDGEEYEPDEDDVIEVTIENEEILEALEEERELTVFHMEDEDDEPEQIAKLPPKTKKPKFSARHFSIYIVGEDGSLIDHNVYKLYFYLEDQTSLISTQTVSPGEKVEMPSVPDIDDYEFVGWYSEPNGEGDKYDFYNDTMPEITDGEDHEIDLYAHYTNTYYVHYMTAAHEEGDDDTKAIFHSESYTAGQTLDTSAAEELYLAEGYLSYFDEDTGALITALAVTGWLDADGTRWETGDTIDWSSIDGDLELYPIVEAAYWVYYDMNGHDAIENPAPEYVLASETKIGELPEPEVSGYAFGGWYTASEGGDLVTADSILADLPKNTDGSITLYAHWDETYVAYTINIWRQKATDGKQGLTNKEIVSGEGYDNYISYYDYAESHYVSADQSRLKTGDKPTTSTVDNWSTYTGYESTSTTSNNYRNHPEYYGFEYSNTTAQTRTVNELATKTMASDGSTIINIYYNRVTITWNFGISGNSTRTGTLIGLYDTNVSLADDVEPGGTLSSWPANSNNMLWSATTSNTDTTFKARFDLDYGTTVNWREDSHTSSHYLYFYLEVTNEDTQVDENGSKAQEADEYGVAYTRTVNNTLYVYNQTTRIGSDSFSFTDKYSGYYLVGYIDRSNGANYTQYTSASAGGSHTFSNNGYIFNNAITDNTITLISSDKVVGVDAAGDAVTTSQDVTYPNSNITAVKYGTAMSAYPFPETLDGATWGPAYYYYFVGWYEDPTLTAPFSITTMPNNNVVAYADWKLNEITVTFVTGTDSVEAPEVQKLTATQKATDPGTLERDGYTHVGWVDQNGKVFNFDTVLYADTTLTAIWKADDETGYTMRYDLNTANSYGLFDGYEGDTTSDNPEHFTVDEELWTIETAFSALEGTDYEDAYDMFIGWNTAADGSGTLYYPDDDFTITDDTVINDDVITLYAVWAHKNESTLILVHNYPDGYELLDDEKEQDTLTGDNLTAIKLTDESGLEYHHEITVTDSNGTVHTYRFDGWSTTDPGNDPTDDDVDIEADATVAVDTLDTNPETNANYLFAVWLEVHNITVTKEVVNDAVNYTVPEDQTFTFTWSFVDGEGETNTNKEDIVIKDGEYFIIPDVASGESVTIIETPAEGFTTSYNGAQVDAADDGNGTYAFTMEDDSTAITVYNTVETIKVAVEKVWEDINENTAHDPVTVNISNGDVLSETLILSSDNNWFDEVEFAEDSSAEFKVDEEAVDGYETTISGPVTDDNGISFTVTNTEIENPSLSVEKTAEVDDDYVAKLGDEITYTIKVTNNGNVTITNITVTDEKTGLEETIESLASGESETYTTTYTVTEADIAAGSIVNTATAIGTSPDGTPEDTEGSGESEIVTEEENPSLLVEKTAEVDDDYIAKLGDEITYTITVTNDGNVTIKDITVKDEKTGLEETIESLAPNESKTYSTTYTVTEADIEAGSIVNTATAIGTSPDGESEDTEGSGKSEIETEKENPSLSVKKTAEVDDDYVAKLGDEITYTITVTNDGNVMITDITVKDELTGLEETIDSLAKGESKTYTTIYTVTEADIEAGSIVNTATAIGTSPDGEPEDTEGSGDVTIETEKENDNDRGFYDIDEEIVPDEGDSSTWEKDEEVEEKHVIEFEMTTTLPSLTEDDLKGLVEDGFTLVFHNDLDDELKLDSEENTDLHITIGGKTIGSEYYSIDINQSKDEWSISTLSAKADDDGCAFHVTVDLSKLYEAKLISADDFAGDTQITVFFYADLEGAVEGQKYESTVWYEVYDGEEAIYTSSKDTVTVHVKSTEFVPSKSVDKGEGITVYYGDSLTYTITYKNTSDEAATVTITDTLNSGLTFSSASDDGEYDSSSRTVTWTLENVEAGYEGSVTLTATVNSIGRTNGNVTNTAYVKVGNEEAVEVSSAVTNPVYRSTSSGSSGSSGSTTTISHVRNVNNGKTGHWILEGALLTLPNGSHPSNEYLDVDGEIWAFYTYGYAVNKRHTQYYTDEAISAVGNIPRVTGTWDTIGWWFEYDDGTYPHDEWALLEYNGITYWYHFDVDGWMDDGWYTENGNTYYLDPVYDGWRGHMMTGWQLIGGYWYYFSEDANTLGAMVKDTTTPDGFYVDANGHWVE